MNFLTPQNLFSLHYFDGNQKKFWLGFLFYIFILVFSYLFFYFFEVYSLFPSERNLVNWDAQWYEIIKNKGYEYYWYMASDSAFFPLFPYLWKLLHFNSIGISLFNLLLFGISVSLLVKHFLFEVPKVLMYISLPSCVFFFLPYSESLFFFFSTLFLIGLKSGNTKLIVLGLFFCSLTRATAMFFIPSIILMEVFSSEKFLDKKSLLNIVLYSVIAILGLAAVVIFQYSQTYTWFAFAKQQINFWGHYFRWPGFPLVSHGGEKILWIDSLAFLSGIFGFLFLLIFFIKKLFGAKSSLFNNKPFWFATSYIFMVTVYSLFFNFKCLNAQTSIDSINRYVFSTAFSFVFILTAINYYKISLKNFIYFLFVFVFVYIFFGIGGQ